MKSASHSFDHRASPCSLVPCTSTLAAGTTNHILGYTFHFKFFFLWHFFFISAAAQCKGSWTTTVNSPRFSSFTRLSVIGTPSSDLPPLCSQFKRSSCSKVSLEAWTFECSSYYHGGGALKWWHERYMLYQTSRAGRDRGELIGSILFQVNMECVVYRYWLSMSLLLLKWEFCYDGIILKEETKWQFDMTLCYFQCQTTEEQLFRKHLRFRKRHIGNTIACQVFDIKIYCCWFTTFLNIPLMSTGQTYLAL